MRKGGVQQKGQSSKKPENIVLVGRTGNGKSATGNSLIGRKVFESKAHASGVTMNCQTSIALTGDCHTFNVIDTPGLFDLSVSAEFISKEIVRCLTLAEGGIHVVLLVLSARTRITQEEQNTLLALQALFGIQILNFVIIVFTGGDVLEEDNKTLQDYLGRDCPAFIKQVLRMSGNRMVVFDNKTHDEGKKAAQVHKLLSLIDEIRRNNRGETYTGDMYHEIKVETEKLHKRQEELESKNHSKELISGIKDELQAEYQEKMNRLSDEMEKKMKDALEAMEKAASKINNSVPLETVDEPGISSFVLPIALGVLGYSGCSIL